MHPCERNRGISRPRLGKSAVDIKMVSGTLAYDRFDGWALDSRLHGNGCRIRRDLHCAGQRSLTCDWLEGWVLDSRFHGNGYSRAAH